MDDRRLLVIIITRYVTKVFFNKDRYKGMHWMSSTNSNFGQKTPKQLILDGEGAKVWDMIESKLYDVGELD